MIENIVNRHIYIGSSKDIDGRVRIHTNALDDGNHHSDYLQNAWNKYGFENFVYDILIICDEDMLLFYEQSFIDAWKPAYNMSKIAGRIEMTEEVCHKISVANRVENLSVESRERRSIAKMGNTYGAGHKMTDDNRAILMEMNIGNTYGVGKGKPLTEERKQHLSEINMGRTHTEETKHIVSVSLLGNKRGMGNHNHTGHKATEESRRGMSESQKKRFAREKVIASSDQQWECT